MKCLSIASAILVATVSTVAAQTLPTTPNHMADCGPIATAGASVPNAANAEVAFRDMIDRIVSASGLARNFEICAAGIPNAAAVVLERKRYILFHPSFMDEMTKMTGSRWAAASIMAHEVGHHLNGHTLTRSGSHPKIELEADEFSGFILQRLGATLQAAQAAIKIIAPPVASKSHPARAERLNAIAQGWTKACKKDPYCAFDDTESDSFGLTVD